MSQNIAARIKELLTTALAPTALAIEDQSARHAGHAGAAPGGETHFAITIESARFSGLSRVEQHRLVYATLAPLMNNPIHALALTTLPNGHHPAE